MRRILVPLDGSTLAESVVPYVLEVARLTGAAVTLFQGVEPVERVIDDTAVLQLQLMARTIESAGEPTEGLPAPTAQDLERQATERAHTYLVTVAQRLSQTGLEVHTRTGQGPAAEQIVEAAREFDLVAMATHGRGGLGRWVYGSVADRVLRAAPVPVLLIRATHEAPPARWRPRRIMVPLDGSELAERALPPASALARRASAEVALIQSIYWARMAVADYPYGYGAAIGDAELLEEAEAGARDYLAGISQRLTREGLTVVTEVRLDPAADAILAGAAEQHADLIVMSTHGRGGLGRWVLGSVADRVLRGATIPILLVRADVPVDADLPADAAAATPR